VPKLYPIVILFIAIIPNLSKYTGDSRKIAEMSSQHEPDPNIPNKVYAFQPMPRA